MAQQKVYGDSKVFCGGRFVSGPDARSCIASLLMICVPSILWQVDVGTFLLDQYGPGLMLFNGVLEIASLCLLLATALSDPGIVPRQESFTEQYDARTKSYRMKQPPRYFDVLLRGHNFKLKYCTTCSIYRPPRCTHCSVCENCVERFDHHCPWIGNCVGRRNYWLFYSFIMSTGSMNVASLATAVAKVAFVTARRRDRAAISVGNALLGAIAEVPLTVAIAVYCTALVWFTVGLCMYHTYLMSTNQTTYEQVKGTYSDGRNPFHRGILRNLQDVLCSPVRNRYFDAQTGSTRWPSFDTKSGARSLKVALNE